MSLTVHGSYFDDGFTMPGHYKVSGQQRCPLYIVISDFCGFRAFALRQFERNEELAGFDELSHLFAKTSCTAKLIITICRK